MSRKVVFYSRCKPQDCDAVDIALANNIIFIGYPLWRMDAPYNPRNLASCLVSPAASADVWDQHRKATNWPTRQYAMNRNLVQDIGEGSIALIPRPDRGVIYAGYVQAPASTGATSPFEVVDNPPWYDEYIKLRADRGLWVEDGNSKHAGDIAQVWHVDQFRALPIPDVPAWIRGSLFGRSTYARIHSSTTELDAYDELKDLIDRETRRAKLEWTEDNEEVFARLARHMTPSNFEHFVVSLLQLENQSERWFHVGGSGDGGADGLGYTEEGDLAGVLQCKLVYHGATGTLSALHSSVRKECRQYLATLHHDPTLEPKGPIQLLGREQLVRLAIKYSALLPDAMAMRIGRHPSEPIERLVGSTHE